MLSFQSCVSYVYSITTKQGKHLVIDAGHISISSELADKEAIRQIHLKRKQPYSEEDFKRLESMMYDRLSLRLQDAQVGLYISSPNMAPEVVPSS